MPTDRQGALESALRHILRALVRLLLHRGVPFGAAVDVLRSVYVDVAEREFTLPGRKQSTSRIATLTGIPRKEVARLRDAGGTDATSADSEYNRAARVLTGWVRDPDFHDARGRPKPLPFEGDTISFSTLARRHSGDVPARAIADELVRVGAVTSTDDGRLKLVQRAYVPASDAPEKLNILGTDVAALIETIDHNLRGDAPARFQRKVRYDRIPLALRDEVVERLEASAQQTLEDMDRDLARADLGDEDSREPTTAIGVGVYLMEERR